VKPRSRTLYLNERKWGGKKRAFKSVGSKRENKKPDDRSTNQISQEEESRKKGPVGPSHSGRGQNIWGTREGPESQRYHTRTRLCPKSRNSPLGKKKNRSLFTNHHQKSVKAQPRPLRASTREKGLNVRGRVYGRRGGPSRRQCAPSWKGKERKQQGGPVTQLKKGRGISPSKTPNRPGGKRCTGRGIRPPTSSCRCEKQRASELIPSEKLGRMSTLV